ncbi:MAG: phospholipase D-like domain-containing protein [Candidatus Bathyarchaeia archaeon]|jgi:phosphatidylserine/phosphatidylglycerophosphate/cardiolipin synthase-like enzyme
MATKIIQTLKENNGKLHLGSLLSMFPVEEQPLAELKVMALVRSQNLELKKENRDYVVILRKPIIRSKKAILKDRIYFSYETKSLDDIQIVATIPASLLSDLPTNERIIMTDIAFDHLLNSAREYVKVSLPFPEESIVTHFSMELKRLAKAGVKVFLLTREVLDPQKKDYHYMSLIKSVLRMWDIYRAFGNSGYFAVKDFHENLRLGDSQLMHYESTHAKLVLVDGIKCYVGSAEFRLNSLYNNFELGFVAKGKLVKEIETLFDVVWKHANAVSYNFLRKMVKAPTSQ